MAHLEGLSDHKIKKGTFVRIEKLIFWESPVKICDVVGTPSVCSRRFALILVCDLRKVISYALTIFLCGGCLSMCVVIPKRNNLWTIFTWMDLAPPKTSKKLMAGWFCTKWSSSFHIQAASQIKPLKIIDVSNEVRKGLIWNRAQKLNTDLGSQIEIFDREKSTVWKVKRVKQFSCHSDFTWGQFI